MTTKIILALGCALACACQSAMHDPPPLKDLAPGAGGRSAEELVRAAGAAWARRGERGQAETAQDAYLAAAALDEHRIDALLGALAAMHYRLEYEAGAPKQELSSKAVQVAQWCVRRAPGEPACTYRLAIALGQEAREHPLQGRDALAHMIDLLHTAIAVAPALDAGGPHRVLALVLVRAPGWPEGPGDPGAALEEARAAVAVAPEAAENQLALAETLDATGSRSAAHDAYAKAAMLAAAAGVPEASYWRAYARAGLAKRD